MSLGVRRRLAVAIMGVAGSAAAFATGAALGSKLERQTRAVSVGRVTVVELQSAVDAQTTPAPAVQVAPVAQAR
jgi:hypothetical protein